MALSPIEKRLTMMLTTYWHEHRSASDTPEGILRWWLPDAHGVSIAEIMAALAWLDGCLLVEKKVARDGRVRYRLRKGATEAHFERALRRLASRQG